MTAEKESIAGSPCPCDCACHRPNGEGVHECADPLVGTEDEVEHLGQGGRFVCLFCYTTCEGVE